MDVRKWDMSFILTSDYSSPGMEAQNRDRCTLSIKPLLEFPRVQYIHQLRRSYFRRQKEWK